MEFIPVNFDTIDVNLSKKFKNWHVFNTCKIKKSQMKTRRIYFKEKISSFLLYFYYDVCQDVYKCIELVTCVWR